MFKSSLEYHDLTSYDRYDMKSHHMDWPNQPSVFKDYEGLEFVPLLSPDSFQQSTLSDLLSKKSDQEFHRAFDYSSLSAVLHLTQAVTAKAKYGGSHFYYRSVASAGALYPFETYVNVINIDGLLSGLYHHNLARNGLERLHGKTSTDLLRGVSSIESSRDCGAVFLLTSIFFRSSWKYRDRAYRYHLLDTGHLLENLTMALSYQQLDYRILFDFDDVKINHFLNVDPDREVCLAAVAVYNTGSESGSQIFETSEIPRELSNFSRVSNGEVDYSAIRQIHGMTSNSRSASLGDQNGSTSLGLKLEFIREIDPMDASPGSIGYPDAVVLRRSSRNFVNREISSVELDFMLRTLCSAKEPDSSGWSNNGIVVGFLASRAQRMLPGFYIVDHEARRIYLAQKGDLVDRMTHICLDQAWLSNCAVHFLLMADFISLEGRYGPRGYRRAMLTAGRLGQLLYVVATSLRLGCCGIGAFYDSEARNLLGLNESSRLAYLLGVGPIKKRAL